MPLARGQIGHRNVHGDSPTTACRELHAGPFPPRGTSNTTQSAGPTARVLGPSAPRPGPAARALRSAGHYCDWTTLNSTGRGFPGVLSSQWGEITHVPFTSEGMPQPFPEPVATDAAGSWVFGGFISRPLEGLCLIGPLLTRTCRCPGRHQCQGHGEAPWSVQMLHTSSACIMTRNRRVAAAWGKDWKCDVVLAA